MTEQAPSIGAQGVREALCLDRHLALAGSLLLVKLNSSPPEHPALDAGRITAAVEYGVDEDTVTFDPIIDCIGEAFAKAALQSMNNPVHSR